MNGPPLSEDPKFLERLSRPRGDAFVSERYGRFVRWMRLVLPLTALILIVIVAVWPELDRVAEKTAESDSNPTPVGQNELIRPRYESRDEKQQPYTITAEKAAQTPEDPDTVRLDRPQARLVLNGGGWIAASAKDGSYNQKAGTLTLDGLVRLTHDRGYELETQTLKIDMGRKLAWSETPVRGQGPAGTLEASGLRAEMQNNMLRFNGPAKLVLNQSVPGL